jgi:hypothetical protein
MYNIPDPLLQHTSENIRNTETYTYNMHFHRNISLLRSCVTAATTFWWGMMAVVTPQQHPIARGGRGTTRSSGGAVRSEVERPRRGMEHGVAWDGSAALDGGAAWCEMGAR